MNKLLLAFSILSFSIASQAGVNLMGNSLDKTGGSSLAFVFVERCEDGSFAVANDWRKIVDASLANGDGKITPCGVQKGNSGFVKNIGKAFEVNITQSPTIAGIELNSLSNGFMVIYLATGGDSLASHHALTVAAQKCLLLLKHNLATEMRLDLANLEVKCKNK